MPQKGSKKKKSAQQKQSASRYVLPEFSPIATRSKSSDGNQNNSATPVSVVDSIESSESSTVQSVVSKEIAALEARWDTRMDKMENNMRAALMSRPAPVPCEVSACVASAAAPVTAAQLPPVVPVPTAVQQPSSSRDHIPRASSRSSRSSRSSSSSGSSRSTSRHSTSRSKRHRHRSRRSRSRDHSAERSRRRKNGKYTTLKYLPEFSQVSTYERLVLGNARMALKFYKKDRDITGMLEHIILVAEKAEPGIFDNDALIRYDDSVKLSAYEHGLEQFKKLDPAAIFKHLAYDGTKVAANSKRSSGKRFPNPPRNQQTATSTPSAAGPCYKYNFASGGCRRSRCDYRHVCSACFRPGHVNNDCTNVDRPGNASQK